ncbi:unnamed protein product [Paramecium primaurelia]|uniref:Ribosomal protein L13 n=2 Tax=Paramecium TaxID=5884 RepID=A0A8S1XQU8_9CILI|nr:unnamed protein product [Paramecium primaurelia]CAD8203460.1 unnamed protein product [Paramecium pentaurelia]
MQLFQRCLVARFSLAIPKFKPKEQPYVKDIPMPKRPKLDPKDPYEKYELVKPREYEFRQALDERHTKNFYPGTTYVAVHKGGITYHLFDASRFPYGKMCSKIAYYLSGKHKPTFRNNEPGKVTDKFIIVNGCNMYLTGKKINYKVLTYHTGYVGNLKQIKFRDLILQKPEQLVAWTVSKMLPKTVYRMDKLDHIHLFRGRFHTFDDVLPQILPHHTDFEYRGSILQDMKEGDDRTLLFTSKPVSQEQIKQDLGDIKQQIMDPSEMDNDLIFTPFAERPQKIKLNMTQHEYDKLNRRRKRLMQRYRKYMPIPYRKTIEKADFTKSYVVKSEKQLHRLGLQKIKPLDDDPELEDETTKF